MKSDLIGINNRDLNDFSVDINNSISLTSKPLMVKFMYVKVVLKLERILIILKITLQLKLFL
jgi:hypothetical protein